MRDPARIDPVLAAIRTVWTEDPDLRLGQILVIAANLSGREVISPEIFHLEDSELMRGLAAYTQRRTEGTGDD